MKGMKWLKKINTMKNEYVKVDRFFYEKAIQTYEK